MHNIAQFIDCQKWRVWKWLGCDTLYKLARRVGEEEFQDDSDCRNEELEFLNEKERS